MRTREDRERAEIEAWNCHTDTKVSLLASLWHMGWILFLYYYTNDNLLHWNGNLVKKRLGKSYFNQLICFENDIDKGIVP